MSKAKRLEQLEGYVVRMEQDVRDLMRHHETLEPCGIEHEPRWTLDGKPTSADWQIRKSLEHAIDDAKETNKDLAGRLRARGDSLIACERICVRLMGEKDDARSSFVAMTSAITQLEETLLLATNFVDAYALPEPNQDAVALSLALLQEHIAKHRQKEPTP
jgi:hypothetical protein